MNRKEYWQKYYDTLYQRCSYCSPSLKPIIEVMKEKSDISENERKSLYQDYENGSASAKKRLKEYYMRVALQIAYLTSRKTSIALDELFSIALEEMIVIIECFNRPKGEKYLSLYIRNNIQRCLNAYAEKLPKHVSLDEVQNLEYDGEAQILQKLQDEFFAGYIAECKEVFDTERNIIMLHYGLSDGITYTMQEIADKYHITQNYAKYLLRRGLGKLARSEELRNVYGKTKSKSTARKNNTIQTAMKLQFRGREFDIEEIRKAVEADCKAKNYAPVTALEIYIKPEDHAVYYVVNNVLADKIEI